jgi:hypothetical protein
MNIVILLTNGNIGGTAGDATLILRRARARYTEKRLFTRVVLLDQQEQGKINTGDYYYSIEECRNKSLFRALLSEENPKYLILYGDKIQMMTKSLHKYIRNMGLQTKLLLDIQGAVEEKKEYSSSFYRRYVVYPLCCWNFRNAVRNADGAFVVSDEIIEKCERYLGSGKGKLKYYKARCGTDKLFSVQEISEFRNSFRRKRGLDKETIVFCYSGYRAEWQKVNEIIEHFQKFDNRLEKCFFAFFCNTDDSFEDMLKKVFPKGNYSAELLSPEVYFQNLCGCDVGYILRDYNETNRVAFPNKFSDYLSSGLVIALNNALPEPMRVIRPFERHYIDTDHLRLDEAIEKLKDRMNHYPQFLEECISICEKELLYSSQVLRMDL